MVASGPLKAGLNAVRRRHLMIITKLLNDSASSTSLHVTTITDKVPKLAYKMEHRLFQLCSDDTVLNEDTIRDRLKTIISNQCMTNYQSVAATANCCS
ncbi:hypothetical protein ACHHYP_10320 [Achlya hypogyna]|uniref:Uncharacterized protein n=1 Tax=Achlya hypogyna TaxID=1202772 RepID=A0A1V9YLQ3_ACHHY|nr:hypothetical protein ACHHYP_10320 [Achlya hypogyna]